MAPKIKVLIIEKLLQISLRFHSCSYNFTNRLLASSVMGAHPKAEIIKYAEWFKANILENSLVLDVGCHSGSLSALLSDKSSFVIGVDIDESRIQQAQKKFFQILNLKFICADITKIEFQEFSNSISSQGVNTNFRGISIVLSNVLEHIEDRVTFLQTLHQFCSHGPAKLLVRVPDLERDWIVEYKKARGIPYLLDPTHFLEYRRDDLIAEVEESGFIVESLEARYGELYMVAQNGF